MISSIAADQLGIRKVAVAGALLSFAGLLSSSFVKVWTKCIINDWNLCLIKIRILHAEDNLSKINKKIMYLFVCLTKYFKPTSCDFILNRKLSSIYIANQTAAKVSLICSIFGISRTLK